jgi:large subunit ribosomal protein L53
MTEITTKFNPFATSAKPARLFLSFLPPNARQSGLAINTILLPRSSKDPPSLSVKFSKKIFFLSQQWTNWVWTDVKIEDGKQMNLDCEKLGIKGLIEEVDRHSRALQKQADLTD